nr:hypothetical protein [Bacillus cereus]
MLAPVLAGVTAGVIAANAAYKTMMIVSTIAKGIELLTTVLGLSRVATAAATVSQWGLNAAMWANPIGIVVGLIVALIAVGVLLYQNWDEITKWCKEMWATMEEKWDQGVTILKAAYRKMMFEVKQWWVDTREKWDNMVKDVKEKAQKMKEDAIAKYEEMKQAAIQKLQDILNDNAQKWNDLINGVKNKAEEMKQKAVQKYEEMKRDAVQKLYEMVSDAKQKWDDMVQAAEDKVESMKRAAKRMLDGVKDSVKNGFNDAVNDTADGIRKMVNKFTGYFRDFYNSGKGLLSEFTNGIWKGFGDAADAVARGMKNIRAYLPFSPAKKGPLSDLDKSGEAFFPTWYEAALTQVSRMDRAIGGAFSGVADTASVALASTGLEAFTGGRTSVTVNHVVKVDGTVGLDSKGIEEFEDRVTQQVVNTSGGGYGGMDYSGLQQSIRKY